MHRMINLLYTYDFLYITNLKYKNNQNLRRYNKYIDSILYFL